jgi:hypothetical protein
MWWEKWLYRAISHNTESRDFFPLMSWGWAYLGCADGGINRIREILAARNILALALGPGLCTVDFGTYSHMR